MNTVHYIITLKGDNGKLLYVARYFYDRFTCRDYITESQRQYDRRISCRNALDFDSIESAQNFISRNNLSQYGAQISTYDSCLAAIVRLNIK